MPTFHQMCALYHVSVSDFCLISILSPPNERRLLIDVPLLQALEDIVRYSLMSLAACVGTAPLVVLRISDVQVVNDAVITKTPGQLFMLVFGLASQIHDPAFAVRVRDAPNIVIAPSLAIYD